MSFLPLVQCSRQTPARRERERKSESCPSLHQPVGRFKPSAGGSPHVLAIVGPPEQHASRDHSAARVVPARVQRSASASSDCLASTQTVPPDLSPAAPANSICFQNGARVLR